MYRSGEEQDFHVVRNITLNTQEELTQPFPKHFFDAAPLLMLPQQGEGGRQPKSYFCCSAHTIQVKPSH